MSDATSMAEAFASGRSDPVQALEQALEQASRSTSVFISLTTERARREAEASAARWRAGQPLSVFDGVPLAWKDLYDVAGSITTAGAAYRRNAPAALLDAPSVGLLCRAGMVSVGKTNLSELAYSGLGLNPHFGTPLNPHGTDQPRIPGGSSSGSAVAVAAGIVPIAMGTDTAGSIRIPAAFNGLVGYRSSRRRYGFAGVFGLARSLDALGPLTRSVRDAVAIDQLLTGTLTERRPADLRDLHLRIDEATLNDPRVEPAVRDNLERCLQRLAAAGAHIDRRPLLAWAATLDCIAQQGWLGAAEAFASHERLLDSADAAKLDPRVRQRLESARAIPASKQLRLYEQRAQLQAQLHQELDGALLISPSVAHVAPLLAPLEADNELFTRSNLATLRLTMAGSLLDMPGVTLPSGVDAAGLPTGLLLAGCSGTDSAVLRAALAVESLLAQHP